MCVCVKRSELCFALTLLVHELDTVIIKSDVVGMLAALLCVKMFVYLQLLRLVACYRSNEKMMAPLTKPVALLVCGDLQLL